MAHPSHRQSWATVRQTVQRAARWLFQAAEAPRPDHKAHFKADFSMCCAWHQERDFQARPPLRLKRPVSWVLGPEDETRS